MQINYNGVFIAVDMWGVPQVATTDDNGKPMFKPLPLASDFTYTNDLGETHICQHNPSIIVFDAGNGIEIKRCEGGCNRLLVSITDANTKHPKSYSGDLLDNVCELCGCNFVDEANTTWLCPECERLSGCPQCGSDDTHFGWHINPETSGVYWEAECYGCDFLVQGGTATEAKNNWVANRSLR